MCPCAPEPERRLQLRFGFAGGKMTRCSQCKEEGMVDLTKRRAAGAEEPAAVAPPLPPPLPPLPPAGAPAQRAPAA